MADENNTKVIEEDVLVSPDGVDQETEGKVVKKKGSKNRAFLLMGTAAIVGVIGYGFFSGGGSVDNSSVAVPPSMDTTPGGVTMRESPGYVEQLRMANDERFENARGAGNTFIPTSESVLSPSDITSEEIPDAVAPVVAGTGEQEPVEIRRIAPPPTMPQLRREGPNPSASQPQQAQVQQGPQGQQQPEENPYASGMAMYFASVTSSLVPVPSETQSFDSRGVNGQAASAQAGGAGSPSGQQGPGQQQINASETGTFEPQTQPQVQGQPVLTASQTGAATAASSLAGGNGLVAYPDGSVRDPAGRMFGTVGQNGVVLGTSGEVIGRANPDGSVTLSQTASVYDSGSPLSQQAEEEQKIYVPAGDVIYAEVITNNSSDRPEIPVIAKVTVGKYEGARIRGTFTVDDPSGKLVIAFSQMTLEDKTVPIQAMAVDGFNGDSAVRSGIERRYLKRYAPIFASAFLGGLAEGLAETDQQVVGIGDTQTVISAKRTTEESIWAGVGEATDAITGDISSRAPKGPNIKLGSGYPIGILFVDDLRDNPEKED